MEFQIKFFLAFRNFQHTKKDAFFNFQRTKWLWSFLTPRGLLRQSPRPPPPPLRVVTLSTSSCSSFLCLGFFGLSLRAEWVSERESETTNSSRIMTVKHLCAKLEMKKSKKNKKARIGKKRNKAWCSFVSFILLSLPFCRSDGNWRRFSFSHLESKKSQNFPLLLLSFCDSQGRLSEMDGR